MIRIGLVGEFNQDVKAHQAIPQALELASSNLSLKIETTWLPTPQLERDTERQLATYQAVWFVPGTPYASMNGALHAISYAREKNIPTLGTCGGCQHMVIEYARNVLGMTEADHAEEHPDAPLILIAPLVCSLTGTVTTCLLTPGSRVAAIYDAQEITEQYGTCNYGPDAQFWPALKQAGLHVTGLDPDNNARIIEIDQHPFFIGTLFQPELSAFKRIVHPLIKAFLQEANKQ